MLSEGIHTEMRCRIGFKCRTLRLKHMETGRSGMYFVESCQKSAKFGGSGVALLRHIGALNSGGMCERDGDVTCEGTAGDLTSGF